MSRTPLFRLLKRSIREHQTENLERRRILKATGMAVGAWATSPLLSACSSLENNSKGRSAASDETVVILGAGAAGLTAAYQLTKAQVPVIVYEALGQRVGGRMWSHRNFNSEGMFVEMGGELIDTGHTHMHALAKELNLTVEKFPAEKNIAEELYWIGGALRSAKDLHHEIKPLYKQLSSTLKLIQGDAEELSISHASPMNGGPFDQLSLADYVEKCPGLANWVKQVVLIAYTGEMGLDPGEQSALNLITLMVPDIKDGHVLFGHSDEAYRIQGGNSQIPERLAEKLDGLIGPREAWLKGHHRLDAIRDRGSDFLLSFSTSGGSQEVKANQVICTLPFTVLRGIEGIEKLNLHPKKLMSIKELGYGTNSKLMMGFNSRFWRNPKRLKRAYSGSLVVDTGAQSFWETSRLQTGRQGIITNFTGGARGKAMSKEFFAETLGQLAPISAQFQKEKLEGAQLMNWSQSPFAKGSYICLKPGQYTRFYGIEGEVELGGRLLFAGEHTSSAAAGFMEGAVESGVRVAKQLIESRTK